MVVDAKGNSPTLQPLDQFSTAADCLRVKVNACALNFADLLMIEGRYQDMPPYPLVPGMEISGDVLEIGSDVTDFAPGDKIAGFCGHGGLAQEVCVA